MFSEVERHGANWTAHAALEFAVGGLKATSVRIYGMTLGGTSYFDGTNPRNRRDDEWEARWGRERGIWAQVLALAPGRGLELEGVPASVLDGSAPTK